MRWPAAEQLDTVRLLLEPLSGEHAAEMVHVLAAPSLYEFTGGQAPSQEGLARQYLAQSVGQSNDGNQWWLNWIIRCKDSGGAIGFVQATVQASGRGLGADVAWLVAPAAQGEGAATEATRAMIRWLRSQGVVTVVAFIHPNHEASMAVARHQGFTATNVIEDGEARWEWAVSGS